MSNKDVSIQKLEGPYSSHLYIGFAPANKATIVILRAALEKQGLICCLRCADHSSIKGSIQQGVNTSQKCLLFVTSDYLRDEWYEIETKAVVEKSERFCRDVVVILNTEEMEVIPKWMREFKPLQFKPDLLNDGNFLAEFVALVIREPNVQLTVLPKQNIGYGAAYSYFYGFLRLVLPDFKKRLIEKTLKNDPDLIPKTVQKMLIIMPESCFCAVELQVQNKIEFTGKFVNRVAHRAGNQKRDYKSSLYKLIDHERGEEYYFVGELATPLLTMYETFHFRLCGMTQDQLYTERDGFYFTLKAILSHPDNAKCNNQFKLLYWSDPKTEKKNQLEIYDFLLPELRNEIELQHANAKQSPSQVGAHNNGLLSKNPLLLDSFATLEVDGCSPARIYEEIHRYPMDHLPRGFCLIVNIANFEKGHPHLKPRKGAERDAELLTKLFKDLHFKVEVHNDVNAQTLESLFLTMHTVDHTDYDAFVCCILTHGKLGVIYTSDGQPVEILNLVDYFTDRLCSSLKGKPKMFFIQACQRGDPEPENGAVGNSLPRNGSTRDHLAPQASQNMASDSTADIANHETVEERGQNEISCILEGSSNTTVRDVEPAIQEDAISAPTVSKLDGTLSTVLNHKAVLVPGSPDFLMSYSTLPGSISYRDTKHGSLYIQALDQCLRKGMEIDRVLKMVSSSVKEMLRQCGENDEGLERFQLPFHLTSGMDRLIYL